jgi:undecaprenyl-phosphate 4-deoxy-4-formamido-L-arabinose transferase
MDPAVSVVVPVYNSGPTLELLATRVAEGLADSGLDHELVLVNDGSADDSWERITELARRDSRVRGIDLARNYGQHNALLAGIRAARAETTVTIDDDLQNPPEEIPRLLAKLAEGHDVVYGTAAERHQGVLRALGTRLTRSALQVVIGGDIAHKVSAYRAFRTHLRNSFAEYSGPYVSIDVLLSWGTARYAAIPVAHSTRTEGRSGYGFGRLATHAFNVLTGFSTRPLRAASLVGIGFMVFGVGVFLYVLLRWLIGGTLAGFTFLASIISIFSGVQLLTLGVIGEYLARMHMRIMDRPPYAIHGETDAR